MNNPLANQIQAQDAGAQILIRRHEQDSVQRQQFPANAQLAPFEVLISNGPRPPHSPQEMDVDEACHNCQCVLSVGVPQVNDMVRWARRFCSF
jgi:cytochrome c5